MTSKNPYKYFKTSPEIIQLAVMYYIRYPLSFRQVEDILFERGIDICHETVRFWVDRFGIEFARKIRKRRVNQHSNWQWHLDEVFVKINGEQRYLWRAVDHEGEVLESFVTKRRDKRAAKKFLRKAMKKYGLAGILTTDCLPSYRAAFRDLGIEDRQLCGGRSNNRCENSHLPFRRRERAMQGFRSFKTLQKFVFVHSQVYNHFNHQRHLNSRQHFKQLRSATLNEWRELCVA